jgi:hypothetical protein
LEEKLQASKQALNTASSENIIEQCKRQEVVLIKLLNTGARAGALLNSHLRSNFGKRDTVVHEKNTSSLLLGVTD